jgi:murein DD-endopeptidase MepM/ murein hydrolase activator NlpD
MNYEKTYAAYKTYFERNVFVLLVSIDSKSKINGLFIRPFVEDNHPIIERNTTEIVLPFKDEWFVFWGGDTEELNYHVVDRAQKNAFDFITIDNEGKSYKTDGSTNEDYYAYGKEITAPCDGEVVLVVDGIKDNVPGKLNPVYVPGNTVIIRAINGEYIVLAHFKQYSIEVKQGQNVKQGDLIGLCGNSGNSSQAHLHFHLQNVENMNEATGIECYFDEIMVNSQKMINYSPVKGEKVRRE